MSKWRPEGFYEILMESPYKALLDSPATIEVIADAMLEALRNRADRRQTERILPDSFTASGSQPIHLEAGCYVFIPDDP